MGRWCDFLEKVSKRSTSYGPGGFLNWIHDGNPEVQGPDQHGELALKHKRTNMICISWFQDFSSRLKGLHHVVHEFCLAIMVRLLGNFKEKREKSFG